MTANRTLSVIALVGVIMVLLISIAPTTADAAPHGRPRPASTATVEIMRATALHAAADAVSSPTGRGAHDHPNVWKAFHSMRSCTMWEDGAAVCVADGMVLRFGAIGDHDAPELDVLTDVLRERFCGLVAC